MNANIKEMLTVIQKVVPKMTIVYLSVISNLALELAPLALRKIAVSATIRLAVQNKFVISLVKKLVVKTRRIAQRNVVQNPAAQNRIKVSAIQVAKRLVAQKLKPKLADLIVRNNAVVKNLREKIQVVTIATNILSKFTNKYLLSRRYFIYAKIRPPLKY